MDSSFIVYEMENMNNKKYPKSKSSNSTQFILAIPINDALKELNKPSQLQLQTLNSDNNKHNFEVSFKDNSERQTVYLSIKNWNENETFITISPSVPLNLSSNRSMLLIAILSIALISTAILFVFRSYFAFVLVWFVALAGGLYNYRNGIGRSSLIESNVVDSKTLTKENLINSIVGLLADKAEVQLINS